MNLSDRQVRILAFIRTYLLEHNYPPTIREIGAAVRISSTSVVKYNLERLQEKGYLDRYEEVSQPARDLLRRRAIWTAPRRSRAGCD